MWRRPRDQGPRTWPLRLEGTTPHGERIVLRALRATDEASYIALRRANAEWLAPWDATAPHPSVRPRRFADLVAREVAAGASRKDAVAVVARATGMSRKVVYADAHTKESP